MKKMKKIVVALVCLAPLASCTDLVTKEVDSKIIIKDGSGTNVKASEALENSYNALSAFTDQASIYSLLEHTSDELIPPTRGVDWSDNGVWRSLYTHTWDPSHSYINNAWNTLNQNAYNVQYILEASDASAQQKAEAKFLRAFNRYYVVDFWGVLPDRKTSEGVEVNPRVLTRTEGFAEVEKDLLEALADLPARTPADGFPRPTASKASANAMLSRLYLNKAVYTSATPEGPYTFDAADMGKVIKHAAAVMADGYELTDDYFSSFTKTGSDEVILTSRQGSPENRVMMTLHYGQKPSGWNGFATLADFYAKFDANDDRVGVPAGQIDGLEFGKDFSGIGLGFLAGQQYNDKGEEIIDNRTGLPLNFTPDVPLSGAATNKGIRVIKYHPALYDRYVLIRFGEVYMNMVEAKVRGGVDASSPTTALQDINALRAIRGAAPLAAVTLDDVLDERGRELYWEGLRRIDLVRFQKFNDSWSEKGDNKDSFRVLYSIPQLAVDTNPNLKQNPGY